MDLHLNKCLQTLQVLALIPRLYLHDVICLHQLTIEDMVNRKVGIETRGTNILTDVMREGDVIEGREVQKVSVKRSLFPYDLEPIGVLGQRAVNQSLG